MKRISVVLLLPLITLFTFTACIKDNNDVFDWEAQYEIERPIIAEYVETNMPGAILHPSTGIWYEVLVEGIEDSYTYAHHPESNQLVIPTITAQYEGKLLNGTVFDSNNKPEGYVFRLNGVIPAWQAAFIPQELDGRHLNGITPQGLKKGSQIRFVTPSYLGYEDQPNGSIPANSPLVFTLKVLDIK